MNQENNQDLQELLDLLPETLQEQVVANGNTDTLLEIVMDLGRKPSARYVSGEQTLSDNESTREDIDAVVNNIGQFDDDNRAGITRTLHRIAGIRNRRGQVVGLTCRVGRAVYGTVDIIADIVKDGKSVLLLGRPGVGKTTMLREVARLLAEEKRVIIVDTSNEIGGDGDIPHAAVGKARRMQVPRPSHQHETMIEAVENHNPEVIVIDEIGREREAAAARTINERGVQLIGTAHGNTLENLLLNPTLSDLVGGIESVTLSDDEAKRRGTQKTVLERRSPPTFSVLVEIQERQRLLLHTDVAASIDAMLRGFTFDIEMRWRDEEGKLHQELQEMLLASAAVTGKRELSEDEMKGGKNGRSPRRKGKRSPADQSTIVSAKETKTKSKNIYAYGVSRSRLKSAARRLGTHVVLVDHLDEADILVTLKSYYRKQRRLVTEAEQQRVPVYVLRANTTTQMENFLHQVFELETAVSGQDGDPFETAVSEAERAITLIKAGQPGVDLSPASAAVRRYQHQLATQAGLVSRSFGSDAQRYVRVFNAKQ